MRLDAALFVWCVRESCTCHAVIKLFAAQKHGVTLGKLARMASTSAKMPRGPFAGRVTRGVWFLLELQTLAPARLEMTKKKGHSDDNPLSAREVESESGRQVCK